MSALLTLLALAAAADLCDLEAPAADPFVQLEVHERWACARTEAGAVRCVDTNDCTPFDVPGPARDVIAAPVPCALGEDGAVRCVDPFADSRKHDLGYGRPPEGTFKRLAGGPLFACAHGADGQVACWGRVFSQPSFAPDDAGWTRLMASAEDGMCASRPGRTVCWPHPADVAETWVSAEPWIPCGLTDAGALSCPDLPVRYPFFTLPSPPALDGRVTALSRTCALHDGGRVTCWGQDHGQPPDARLTRIRTQRDHACGLTEAGQVLCWGRGAVPPRVDADAARELAQAGIPEELWRRHPNPQLAHLASLPPLDTLVLGYAVGCGRTVDQRQVVCWSRHGVQVRLDGHGPLGPPAVGDVKAGDGPIVCATDRKGRVHCAGLEAPEDRLREDLVATEGAMCGIRREDDRALCWGGRAHAFPLRPPDGPVQALASDGQGICFLDAEGRVSCQGGAAGRRPPVAGDYESLAMSGGYACGLDGDGELTCWGNPDAHLATRSGVAQLFEDTQTPCVRTVDGAVECLRQGGDWIDHDRPRDAVSYVETPHSWNPGYGLAADGSLLNRNKRLDGTWTALAVGGEWICALRDDLRIRCMVGGGRHIELELGPAVDLGVGRRVVCVTRPGGGTVSCTPPAAGGR